MLTSSKRRKGVIGLANLSVIESSTGNKRHWLGRYSKLNDNDTTTTTTKKKTRVIRISNDLHKKLFEHASRYYNHEPYEVIISDLLDCYQKHNKDLRWYNNIKYNDNI